MPELHARATQESFDDASERSRAWFGLALPMALIGVLLTLLYRAILRELAVQWWDDPNYSHGFLVPLFSGYLLWQKREELRAVPSRPTWVGLPVLMAGIAALVLGVIGAENFLMRSSLIVVLAGLVLFHHGKPMLRRVAFPLAFLL